MFCGGITTIVDARRTMWAFFQFGPKIVCYGRSQSGVAANLVGLVITIPPKLITFWKGNGAFPFIASEQLWRHRYDQLRQVCGNTD